MSSVRMSAVIPAPRWASRAWRSTFRSKLKPRSWCRSEDRQPGGVASALILLRWLEAVAHATVRRRSGNGCRRTLAKAIKSTGVGGRTDLLRAGTEPARLTQSRHQRFLYSCGEDPATDIELNSAPTRLFCSHDPFHGGLLSGGDVLGEERCVPIDPRKQRRTQRMGPSKAEKIETGTMGHATTVKGDAGVIEDRQFHPLEIIAETGAPDDRRDPAASEVQLVWGM